MRRHQLTCAGPCGGHQPLGTVDLPDDATPAQVAAATQAYLGEDCDCGPTYRHGVAFGYLGPGQHPKLDDIKRYHDHVAALAEAAAAAAAAQPA